MHGQPNQVEYQRRVSTDQIGELDERPGRDLRRRRKLRVSYEKIAILTVRRHMVCCLT